MLAAAAVLGTSLLSGCGGDDGGDYCDTLSSMRDEVTSLDPSGAGGFEELREVTGDLADAAPDEVADDWEAISKAFDDLESTMDDAGVSMEDFQEAGEKGESPEGVSEEDLIAISDGFTEVGDTFSESGDAITEHAKESCDIDLNES